MQKIKKNKTKAERRAKNALRDGHSYENESKMKNKKQKIRNEKLKTCTVLLYTL